MRSKADKNVAPTLPARCCTRRPCCFLTNRPRGSTRRAAEVSAAFMVAVVMSRVAFGVSLAIFAATEQAMLSTKVGTGIGFLVGSFVPVGVLP